MLKSITRRRKKYIFLDYMIVLLTSIYLRIRTVDTDFYSSLQPNYLWLITILFGLMFDKIGRVKCTLICSFLNILSNCFLSNTNYPIFVSSIYTITYESLILLVVCHGLNVFREKTMQVFTHCFLFGNFLEVVQVFINLKYFKYLLFILIIVLSLIRLKCRQLPQNNYFIVFKHLCTIRTSITQLKILLYVILAIINFDTFIGMITSSLTRYMFLITFPLTVLYPLPYQDFFNEAIFVQNIFLTFLLQFDQLVIFFIAASLVPFLMTMQFILFFQVFYEIDTKISRTKKHLNYDAIVLIHYAFIKNSYAHYDSYEQHKKIIIITSAIVALCIFIKNKYLQICIQNKQNYYNNTYDKFESARNDDTVL